MLTFKTVAIGCSFSGVGFLLQNHYPRSTGAPSCRFRTLTRRPPSVDSGLDGGFQPSRQGVKILGGALLPDGFDKRLVGQGYRYSPLRRGAQPRLGPIGSSGQRLLQRGSAVISCQDFLQTKQSPWLVG